MRTMLRSKVTLLFMTCAVILLVFPAMAFAQGAPTIQSDKEDYAPGSTVTLTGSGWQPGESVHINVNDELGKTWSRDVDVTADANGNITDQFQLPNTFVAVYNVTATGAQSGVVTTSFTDANIVFTGDSSAVAGDTKSYSAAADGGNCVSNLSYAWTVNNGASIQSGQGTSSASIKFNNAGNTTISVALTGKKSNGTDCTPVDGTKSVAVSAAPTDSTAPVITETVTPASPNGSNGWYNSGNVTVSWSVTDPESSISSSNGCGTTTISSDTAGQTLTCQATSAGGTSSKSVTIKRDATPPTNIQFVGGPDAGGSYPFGSVPDEPTCTANGAVSDLASCVVTGYSTAVSAPGTHTMTATATDNAGNQATQTRSYTVTKANQAALTITSPDSGIYGAHLPITTSGGTTNGAVSFQASGTACQIDANNKLEITDGAGTCSVTATMAGNANYNDVTSDAHPVAVSKRAVTVTADAKSKKYGQDDPNLTSQITSGSLVNDDNLSGALTRDSGENVGQYAITQGTLALPASKYELTYVPANLTIDPRPVTVTPDPNQGKTYGENDPAALSYTLSSPVGPPALVGNDELDGALSRASGNNAGTYLIGLGSLSGGPNYDLSLSTTPVNFTIAQRPITITADAQSKLFNDPDPALTYKLTSGSLVSGDSFTGSLTRVAGEAVGQYNILQGTVEVSDGNNGDNYAITYIGAKLTIGAWTLKGFYSPVDMDTATTTALNTVKAGSTVPLKFEVLKGATELTNTSAIKGFSTKAVLCPNANVVADEIEFTTTGGTSLRYDATAPGQFIQNWQTPKKVGCHDVTMETLDGSKIVAHFQLR